MKQDGLNLRLRITRTGHPVQKSDSKWSPRKSNGLVRTATIVLYMYWLLLVTSGILFLANL